MSMSHIGRCPKCKRIVTVAVNNSLDNRTMKDTAHNVAKYLISNLMDTCKCQKPVEEEGMK